MRKPRPASQCRTRRHLLSTGTAGIPGMSLPQILATESQGGSASARAKRVIVVFEQGGLSHLDTGDPKPEAVIEHRSPFAPISTTVPGMQFTSLLSRTAKIAHKLAVVRSMHHNKAGADAHPSGMDHFYV